MRKLNKWLRRFIYFLLTIAVLIIGLSIYLACVALVYPPKPADESSVNLTRTQLGPNCYTIGNNWIRKSKSGLWEMYIEGEAFERGVINGKLSKELIYTQESAFNDQICKLVPSSFYRNFLKYFIAWFNRDLDDNISEEYKLEIYGESKSASPEFDYIGSAYQRIMNYHAAHDIGHALQNMAMVGCSSFATWNGKSQDSLLIVGRNFDFYVGDKFAENKIVLFCNPKEGYKFMSVTWGGMIGVVSGMNMEGITVTINAAKSAIPSGAATPISLLARKVLQYAKNIDEAIKIIKDSKTFVSESFLIGSANDNKAVLIEKTPNSFDVYDPNGNFITCTNHYQGAELSKEIPNQVQMNQSASVYRFERLTELLSKVDKNTPKETVSILRNKLGLHDKFIGLGNEKALNQLICHHSIVFEPQRKLVWISASPWQLGEYVAYDLNKIFAMKGLSENRELSDSLNTIAADSFLTTSAYTDFLRFRKMKEQIQNKETVDVNEFIKSNPEFYDTYVLAGNYLFDKHDYKQAQHFYELALTKEIATKTEETKIKNQIERCIKKQNS